MHQQQYQKYHTKSKTMRCTPVLVFANTDLQFHLWPNFLLNVSYIICKPTLGKKKERSYLEKLQHREIKVKAFKIVRHFLSNDCLDNLFFQIQFIGFSSHNEGTKKNLSLKMCPKWLFMVILEIFYNLYHGTQISLLLTHQKQSTHFKKQSN